MVCMPVWQSSLPRSISRKDKPSGQPAGSDHSVVEDVGGNPDDEIVEFVGAGGRNGMHHEVGIGIGVLLFVGACGGRIGDVRTLGSAQTVSPRRDVDDWALRGQN